MILTFSIIGLLLSILLVVFQRRRYTFAIYLSGFFFLASLYSLAYYALVQSKSVFLVTIAISIVFLFYLIGPMLYWYVRSVVSDDYRLKKRDLWHLLPMTIYLVFILPFLFTSYSHKLTVASAIVNDVGFLQVFKASSLPDFISVHMLYLSRPALVLLYTLWSVGLFISYVINRSNVAVFTRQHFMMGWLSVFLAFQLIVAGGHFLQVLKPFSEYFTPNILQILQSIGIMGLLISPFFFPSILYGLPRIPLHQAEVKLPGMAMESGIEIEKTSKKKIEYGYLLSIGREADACMEKLKPYTNPGFNLAQLSVLIHIPEHHLGYYFREEKKQSFTEYRNEWRVKHAKKLIEEGKIREMTLEAIGLLSGFPSRNTFYRAFKDQLGVSPGKFADLNQKEF